MYLQIYFDIVVESSVFVVLDSICPSQQLFSYVCTEPVLSSGLIKFAKLLKLIGETPLETPT